MNRPLPDAIFGSFGNVSVHQGFTFIRAGGLDPRYIYLVGNEYHLFIGVLPPATESQTLRWNDLDNDAVWAAVNNLNRHKATGPFAGKLSRPSIGGDGHLHPLTTEEGNRTWVTEARRCLGKAKQVTIATEQNAPQSSYRWYRQQQQKQIEVEREVVADLIRAWPAWRDTPPQHIPSRAAIRNAWGSKRAYLYDEFKGKVGYLYLPDGPLVMLDERVRDLAHEVLLNQLQIDVQPRVHLDDHPEFPDASITWDANTAVANVTCQPIGGKTARGMRLGNFHVDQENLVVHDEAFRKPVTTLIRRHGWTVGPVRVEPYPYAMDEVFGFPISAAPKYENPSETVIAAPKPKLFLRSVRDMAPVQYLESLGVTWITSQPRGDTLADYMCTTARYRRQLLSLLDLPLTTTALKQGPCRLCGATALAATGNDLHYCWTCVSAASHARGLHLNDREPTREEAGNWALRQLAKVEFGGPPSIAQLATILLKDPPLVDRAMLYRIMLPNPYDTKSGRERGWMEVLAGAGLLHGEGLRASRGLVSIASDGHPCRSLLERHVDDFLAHNGIPHDIEPSYPYDPDLNATGLRADWLLPGGTFVEALGFPDNPDYMSRVERKRSIAKKYGIPLLTLAEADLRQLPQFFHPWL